MGKNVKISFVIFRKEENSVSELLASIMKLNIPDNCEIDVLEVISDKGIAAAYNEGMSKSGAEYKIYLDEAVQLLNPDLIYELLSVFDSDMKIGMIGVLGTHQIPTNGVEILAKNQIGAVLIGSDFYDQNTTVSDCEDVMAVHGCFMATRVDIPWREDLFEENCFFDTAQCMEMKRKGYRVVVPRQKKAWVKYDFPEIKFDNKSQQLFLNEYSTEIYPLVTILIPTYNRPELLKVALESVINQTYRNLEIIITDNSKNNDTEQMLEMNFHDQRIKYIHQPDNDAIGNWNLLRNYDNPKAEFVNWLMDDDIFALTKIADMMDVFFEEDGITLVTSYRKAIDTEGNILQDMADNRLLCEQTARISGNSAGRELLLQMTNFIGEPTTVLIKKSYLERGNWGFTGDEGEYHIADYSLWLQLLSKGDMVYMSKPLSYFRIHEGQLSADVKVQLISILCWAIELKYAWNKKIFIQDKKSMRNAIYRWISLASGVLTRVEDDEINSVNYLKAVCTLQDMAQALTHDYQLNYEINAESDVNEFLN